MARIMCDVQMRDCQMWFILSNGARRGFSSGEVSRCGDLSALETPLDMPEGAEVRAAVESLQEEVAAGRALWLAGKYDEGRDRLQASEARARELEYEPVLVELLTMLGRIQHEGAQYEASERTLGEATSLALALGMDRAAVDGLTNLVYAVGYKLARMEEANIYAKHARALLRRIGGDKSLESSLETNLGAAVSVEGTGDEVYAHMKRALDLHLEIYEPTHPALVRAWSNLGFAQLRLDDQNAEAIASFQRALEVGRASLGEEHPSNCLPGNNLGYTYLLEGRNEEAEKTLGRVLELCEPVLGKSHPTVALVLFNQVGLLIDKRRFEEAERLHHRVTEINAKSMGADHPDVLAGNVRLGWLREEQGRYEEALEIYEDLAARIEKAAPEGGQLPGALGSLARLELHFGRIDAASTHARRAIELGQKHQARETVAEARFVLARALAKQGSTGEARELAALARTEFEAGRQPIHARRLRELDRWLAKLPSD